MTRWLYSDAGAPGPMAETLPPRPPPPEPGTTDMAEQRICVTFKDSGTVEDASNTSPITITSSNHGLDTGARVTITGVEGNVAANGDFTVTKVSGDRFSLDGTTGSGDYTQGGKWRSDGITVQADAVMQSAEEGSSYKVNFSGSVYKQSQ